MLYTFALLFGLADAFFYPAQSAMIPRLLGSRPAADRQRPHPGHRAALGVPRTGPGRHSSSPCSTAQGRPLRPLRPGCRCARAVGHRGGLRCRRRQLPCVRHHALDDPVTGDPGGERDCRLRRGPTPTSPGRRRDPLPRHGPCDRPESTGGLFSSIGDGLGPRLEGQGSPLLLRPHRRGQPVHDRPDLGGHPGSRRRPVRRRRSGLRSDPVGLRRRLAGRCDHRRRPAPSLGAPLPHAHARTHGGHGDRSGDARRCSRRWCRRPSWPASWASARATS